MTKENVIKLELLERFQSYINRNRHNIRISIDDILGFLKTDEPTKITKPSKNNNELGIGVVSGCATDFEEALYVLINKYVDNGLKKPDLVRKMNYVTKSCVLS